MSIKSLHFKWFWLYRLVLIAIGITIYLQHAAHKKLIVYSPLNSCEFLAIELYNQRILERSKDVVRIFDESFNITYLNKMTLMDSLSKGYDPDARSDAKLLEQVRILIDPSSEKILRSLDSITRLPDIPPVLDTDEILNFHKTRQAIIRHLFNQWCSDHIEIDCRAIGFFRYRPELFTALPSEVHSGDTVRLRPFLSSITRCDIKMNDKICYDPDRNADILDTIFPAAGLIPLIFDLNVHVFKNDGKTHHKDTIFLQVLPKQ